MTMSTQQNDIKDLMAQLQGKGWTLAAIADSLDYPYRTIQNWAASGSNARYPSNAPSIRRDLGRLLERRRIPKRKRYHQSEHGEFQDAHKER
jgi:hypothetical protein